jgi:hypothetical protein
MSRARSRIHGCRWDDIPDNLRGRLMMPTKRRQWTTESESAARTCAHLHSYWIGDRWWTDGSVSTFWGTIDVYGEIDYSKLEFVWHGRRYRRYAQVTLTHRGFATVAARFAREIAMGPN